MQFPTIENFADTPRRKLFWAVVAVVALVQLAALYLLCVDQVRQGQLREASYQVQRLAITECLQSVPNSTIGSCARQAAAVRYNDGARTRTDGVMTVGHSTGANPAGSAAGRTAMAAAVSGAVAFR